MRDILKDLCRFDMAVLNYYILEQLSVDIPKYSTSHAVIKLKDDLLQKKEEFCDIFARSIRDYLIIVSIGEARYALNRCGVGDIYLDFADAIVDRTYYKRDCVYTQCIDYAYNPLLPVLLKIFSDNTWRGQGYGGKAWYKIVKTIYMYDTLSAPIFIDHIVDLSHNSANVFTKNVLFCIKDLYNYKTVLDYKRDKNILEIDKQKIGCDSQYHDHFMIYRDVKKLLVRADNLLNVRISPELLSATIETTTPYALHWGNIDAQAVVKVITEQTQGEVECRHCGHIFISNKSDNQCKGCI